MQQQEKKVTVSIPNDIPEIAPCGLCGEKCDPTNASGCDRSNEKDCNWYNPTTEEVLNDLLKNDQVRQQCLINAQDIEKRMKGKWFTLSEVVAKLNVQPEPFKGIIDLLCFFGMCYRKEVAPGLIKHKITIGDDDRLKLLEEELKEAEGKVMMLKSEIEKLLLKEQAERV